MLKNVTVKSVLPTADYVLNGAMNIGVLAKKELNISIN